MRAGLSESDIIGASLVEREENERDPPRYCVRINFMKSTRSLKAKNKYF